MKPSVFLIGNPVTMTVKELKEALSKYPDEFTVLTKGCDCFGDVVSVKHVADTELLIERSIR